MIDKRATLQEDVSGGDTYGGWYRLPQKTTEVFRVKYGSRDVKSEVVDIEFYSTNHNHRVGAINKSSVLIESLSPAIRAEEGEVESIKSGSGLNSVLGETKDGRPTYLLNLVGRKQTLSTN
ncbi:MAG: hypothetical protein CL811_12855 [Colwelliaceae bacterium]|nr:hypothetical protein [Colwelliaceae bacterium]|tara:strand:+ start:1797 stop:2159 length:363 start_codon:yes stop_codon:yes gene_type:complete